MATAPRIITLNLGSQTIGLAEFQLQPQAGLLWQNFRRREITADPAAEAMRNGEIAAALGEMMEELRLKKGDVNFAVPGQSVFTRFVKLPIVEEEKIERIISFEAQQNVPFPIDEVVWDYQLVGGGAAEEIQVVLVAIKSELLDQMNDSVEGTGLRPRIVDVAPMALYNAFRFNYPDLSGGGCSLLVDMGARTTNLLFIEAGRIFSRSVPIGGASITAAIMKEFGETFAAAEVRKKRDGFVSLGGAYLEPSDPSVARLSKIVGGTMTRLHAEVMRSISHYRGQQQGHAPERVFLCGGSATTPYTREFLSEKLQLPVEFFNPLRNVAVGPSAPVAELTRSAHLLGELVGLALRMVSGCPMELNLRPEKVRRRHDLEKRRPMLVMAAACVVLAVLGWAGYYARAARVMHESLNQLQTKIDMMHAAEGQLAKLKKQTISLDNVATQLIAVVDDRSFWVELLQDLNARLPKQDIWITELIPTSDSQPIGENNARVTTPLATTGIQATSTQPRTRTRTGGPVIDGILIRGLYLFNPKQEEVVMDYFRSLIGSPFFKISPSDQARVVKSSIPNNTDWAFEYELHLDLRKPLSLP
jgi:type IV pilus assembly protein PilM